MLVDMNLVRADPKLKLTPLIQSEAETDLTLDEYVTFLLEDLAAAPDPLQRALSLVQEGNVALARRLISSQNLSKQDLTKFESYHQSVQKATNELASNVERRIVALRDSLRPGVLTKCLSMQHAWRTAIQEERFHIAQADLVTAQRILSETATDETAPTERESADRGGDETAPEVAQEVSEIPKQEPVQTESLLETAIEAWLETVSMFSSPVRAYVRPSRRDVQSPSYNNVRYLLSEICRMRTFDFEQAESALRAYFFLTGRERRQLQDRYSVGLLVFAVEQLKRFITLEDFDSAGLVRDDVAKLLTAHPQLSYPPEAVHDFSRYGVEVQAALLAADKTKSLEEFESLCLADHCLRDLLSRRERTRTIDSGKVLFFYYRLKYLDDDRELVRFFNDHSPLIHDLAAERVELNRFYEGAKDIYNKALVAEREREFPQFKLSAGTELGDTLRLLRDLRPDQVVSALELVLARFEGSLADGPQILLLFFRLVHNLFDMQKPEELVFARDGIFRLTASIRALAKDNQALLDLADRSTLRTEVLDSLDEFLANTIAAISSTDYDFACRYIDLSRQNLLQQREYLQDMGAGARRLWHMLGDHWISMLTVMQRSLSRKTTLSARLQSNVIVADQPSTLVVYLRNSGPGTARHVEIAIVGSGLRVDPGIRRRGLLADGDEEAFSFAVRPQTTDKHFDIRLLIRHVDANGMAVINSESRTIMATPLARKRMPVESPYVWGQPLVEGSNVFVGREDVFDFLKARFWGQERNKIVALQGERRMGKTSILHQIKARRFLGDYRVVLFDFQGRYANFDSMGEFLYGFARRIRSEARLSSDLMVSRSDFQGGAREYYDFFEGWLDRVERELEQRDTQIIILFDEFEKLLGRRFDDHVNVNPRLVEELLQHLRSVMQTRKRLNWIIAGSWGLVAKQRDYFSSLFGMAISYWVSYLQRDDAIALITKPVEDYLLYDQDAVDHILRLTGGHPFYLQVICDGLVARARSLHHNRVQLEDVSKVVEEALTQITESSFRILWTSLDGGVPRIALSSIAEAMSHPSAFVPKKDIVKLLWRKYRYSAADSFLEALDRDSELMRRELIEGHMNEPDRVRIRTELLYRWLRMSKPLTIVMRDERR